MDDSKKDSLLLVVDDDPDIRECLTEVLSDEGYEVRTAANGVEALEFLRQNAETPCLVLLDLMMPIMNGFQVLEALEKNHVLARIPVVVVSASHTSPDPRVSHLRKPVNLNSLLELVEERSTSGEKRAG